MDFSCNRANNFYVWKNELGNFTFLASIRDPVESSSTGTEDPTPEDTSSMISSIETSESLANKSLTEARPSSLLEDILDTFWKEIDTKLTKNNEKTQKHLLKLTGKY